MIKVAFCCPYQIERLLPEIVLSENIPSYPCSWITNITTALARHEEIDLHVVTISSNVPFDQTFYRDNIHFYVLNTARPTWKTKYFRLQKHATFFKPVWKMLMTLKRIQPDITHGHGTEGPFSIPVVYSKYPHVISIQGIIAKVFLSDPTLRLRVIKAVEKHTIKKANAINVKSVMSHEFTSAIAADTLKYFIEPSIDPVFWSCSTRNFSRNLFFVGNLVKRKGIEEWLKCFIKLKKIFIDLKGWVIGFGDKSYVNGLEKTVDRYLAKNDIVFIGQLSHKEIVSLYAKGGVFLLPSHVENSPNALMEAMAAGLPVVSTDVGDIKNIVEDGESGFLVEKKDVSGMVKAIASLLRNKELYFSLGKHGREIATVRWKPDIIAQKHIEMYKDILSKK